jgi:thioredoxin 1
MTAVHDVSDASFEQDVLQSGLPVVVDLWAEWCEPCLKLNPVVEKLAAEYAGRLKVCKMDVAANPRTASQYHIMSIPTLLFIRNGQVVGQHTGGAPAAELSRKIEGHLGLALC